jgi:hypothetical protein
VTASHGGRGQGVVSGPQAALVVAPGRVPHTADPVKAMSMSKQMSGGVPVGIPGS